MNYESMGDDGELFNKLYKLVFKTPPVDESILSSDENNPIESSEPPPFSSLSTSRLTSMDPSQLSPGLPSTRSLEGPMRFEQSHSQALESCQTHENAKLGNNTVYLQKKCSKATRREIFIFRGSESHVDDTWKDEHLSCDLGGTSDTSWQTVCTKHCLKTNKNENSEQWPEPSSLNETLEAQEPLRPLSAYNYFFREERERILAFGITSNKTMFDCKTRCTLKHQQALLSKHWNQDRTLKRRHRKSHGIISFSSLSKLVSERWKELPDEHKNFYKELAAKDWSRYQMELEIYNQCISSDIDHIKVG